MKLTHLNENALDDISFMLKTLSDKTRIKIMQCLHEGEKCVTDIVKETGGLQANISKHLQLLSRAHLVVARKEGLLVYYTIADPCVQEICDAVCKGYLKLLKKKLKNLKGRPS